MVDSTTPILEATLRLIVEGGVHAVTFRDVAVGAKVSLGTVSYQFPSRSALLYAAFTYFMRTGSLDLRSLAAARTLKTAEDFGTLCADLVRGKLMNPSRLLVEHELIGFSARYEGLSTTLAEFDRAVLQDAAAILEGLNTTSPLAAAETVMDVVRGFQLAHIGRPTPDYEAFGRRIAHVVQSFETRPFRDGPNHSRSRMSS